jgi:hypothetical protein
MALRPWFKDAIILGLQPRKFSVHPTVLRIDQLIYPDILIVKKPSRIQDEEQHFLIISRFGKKLRLAFKL